MNLEQLNAMTDLELDEAVALMQGWTITTETFDENHGVRQWIGLGLLVDEGKYHPTANTTEGKTQAFELMVKHKIDFNPADGIARYEDGNGAWIGVAINEKPLRAIAIAAILSAQEK